jgi:hypothetical protein
MRTVRLIITLGALVIALVHLLLPQLVIDGITVTLLAIATIPWLGPLFKAIELPGGVKVEYHDLERVEKKAEEAGLLPAIAVEPLILRPTYAFQSVAGEDSNLALAGLRIEIESRLRDIATSKGLEAKNQSAGRLLRELRNHGYLSAKEVSVIEDLLPLLNRAAHGAEVDERAFNWALDTGTRLLSALEERKGAMTMPQLLEHWHKADGGAVVEVGSELSKAFVQSPLAFLQAMKSDEKAFSTWLEGLQHHTLTLFNAPSELEGVLYTAYYEKLKQLMQKAAQAMLATDCGREAQKILDALDTTRIGRVW